jgi:peptide/nickel transport system permease protein
LFNQFTALDFSLWRDAPSRQMVLWLMIGTAAIVTVATITLLRLVPARSRVRVRATALIVAPLMLFWWWSAIRIQNLAVDLLAFLVMPILVLFLLSIGDIILVISAAMDGLSQSDFVLTARAKGLSDRQVRNRHAGRIALLPALARLAANLPFALGGLVIVEASFARLGGYRISIPGVSSILFGSLRQRDLLMTMGGLVLVGVITLVLRIALDLLVVRLDPRVHLEKVVVRA